MSVSGQTTDGTFVAIGRGHPANHRANSLICSVPEVQPGTETWMGNSICADLLLAFRRNFCVCMLCMSSRRDQLARCWQSQRFENKW